MINLTQLCIDTHQKIKLKNINCCRFILMKRFLLMISMGAALSNAQPKEGIEFKVNTITGYVIDSTTSKPVMDVNIDIYTGNGVLKHSTITDEYGYYERPIVGYLWKPKIRFTLHNYYKKIFRLDPAGLDSILNINVNALIVPVPEEKRIPDLEKSTITNRAETFFIKGNVFYNLVDGSLADRIIISTAKAIETKPDFILMEVNGEHYDVARCYVPQEGKYENLSFIMRSMFDEPIFENSGNPIFLNEDLLEPTIIYGSIIDISTGDPILGAEVILSEPYKRRISNENGRYAFQVTDPGRYHVTMNPPPDYKKVSIAKPEIIIKYGRGGWFKSDFYVHP